MSNLNTNAVHQAVKFCDTHSPKQSKENKVIIDGQKYYDCWKNIFDLLSLRDIFAMIGTCKRMAEIGGRYFSEISLHCDFNQAENSFYILFNGNDVQIKVESDILRFFDTLQIKWFKLNGLNNIPNLDSFTTLCLSHIDLRENDFKNIPASNIESLELVACKISDENSFGKFFVSFPKLKCLKLMHVDLPAVPQCTYPMLESFEYLNHETATNQLISFLERNPNIKELQINHFQLLEIPLHKLPEIHLDYLNIDMLGLPYWKLSSWNMDRWWSANGLSEPLKLLYAKGFFKKLRVSINCLLGGFDAEKFITEMASFGALEALFTQCYPTSGICNLTQIKELYLNNYKYIKEDLETIAMNFVNLEKLSIQCTTNELLLFLRHSKKLKFVLYFDEEDSKALDLQDLNRLRQKNGMENKVTIGVCHEWSYLATKWIARNVNYDLVEITLSHALRKYFHYKFL